MTNHDHLMLIRLMPLLKSRGFIVKNFCISYNRDAPRGNGDNFNEKGNLKFSPGLPLAPSLSDFVTPGAQTTT